ncbi:ABC transporter ATP-binding protein [Neofamilia massiliensis]|uniref:ABC transporter ATP-binding protein n=1 Tax=Neofamilia massiliensis TaxID=1673724 RepID=UPI0006BB8A95|nr:ABC transporter ATP-binding protein [Neofamilia massiliensis]
MIKNKSYFSIILRNSREYFSKGRGWAVTEQLIAVFRALVCAAEILISKRLFDNVSKAKSFSTIATSLFLLIFVIIFQELLSGLSQYLLSKVSYSNMGKFMVDFQKKLGRLPAIYFEDVNFLDQIEKTKECLEYESLGHFASLCLQMVSYYFIYLLLVGSYLFFTSPLLGTILLLAFVPAVLGQIIKAKYFVDLEEGLAPERRRCQAYKNSIVHVRSYKETRMLGAYKYFFKLFLESLHIMTEKRWQTEKKIAYIQMGLNGFTFLGLGLSIYILFSQLMAGLISVGMFAAVFLMLGDVFGIIDELVSSQLSQGSELVGQVANFYQLMDLEEDLEENLPADFSQGIKARGISFSYPGQSKDAIKNLSLEIKAGETIALVGTNGSGKSTLVKLLTGLYGPDSGQLIIGGQKVQGQGLGKNYASISAVFQNFQRYKLSLKENVTISNLNAKDNVERIKSSLEEASFNYQGLPFETILAPEFAGVDLSGGQWQRLALARGLFRPSEFIILDEPTSAIDPIEESKLYQQFKEIVADRCAVIVTHRLASTKFADRIILMEAGQIVEEGSHEELMKKRGEYYSMWQAQAAWYDNK